jgi:glycosyltransferase involved in cell wall biosynthesis
MSADFSVVIPTFRRPKELKEALASVLSQIGVTLEVFVIDDSPEGSAKGVVESFCDRRVTYLANPKPTGGVPSAVRNLGWPLATGSFVHFLDDDDIVPNGHYIAVRQAFATYPDVGLVFGKIEPFGAGPVAQLEHERQYFTDAARRASASHRFGSRWAFTGRMLFDNALLVCSASVLRRDCIAPLGGFDPSIRLMEDADFHVRVMREFGAHFLDRIAVQYRIGSPSLMHNPDPSNAQLLSQRAGRKRMQTKYREERGPLEFYALALFTRTVLKVL